MRLYEVSRVLPREQLDEINLKKALATGSLALATGLGAPSIPTALKHQPPTRDVSQVDKVERPSQPESKSKEELELEKLTDIIVSNYGIDPELANEIVRLAKKYEKKSFPRAVDILAIIGIESSFNPGAVSGLKTDPAVGLTQIRPNVWGLDANELKGDIEQQISASSDILAKYKHRLKSTEDAVHAYNVGITAFRRGDYNPDYVKKFKTEKKLYL
jgi:hypothetical protein